MSPTDAESFISFVSQAPSPFHVASASAEILDRGGFDRWSGAGDLPDRGTRVRAGSVLAWQLGDPKLSPVIIAAHTDSPNLRIKPQPDSVAGGLRRVGVEVYGSPLLNSWLDRELGVSGQLAIKDGEGVRSDIVSLDRPVLRVPQLAIHLDRGIRTDGLKLNAQSEMQPVWADDHDGTENNFLSFLLQELAIDASADDVLAYELMVHPIDPPQLFGAANEFLAAPRIDNQLSCWAAVEALRDAEPDRPVVVALFDHEEVGSVSATGADSVLAVELVSQIMNRASLEARDRALVASTDCAHATHPNYPDRHDPSHQIKMNGGPVVKVNANQRYATTAMSAAAVIEACTKAGVGYQRFVSRSDMPCGSTVGPMSAAALGIDTVDVGAAMLSMHSAREMTGSADPGDFRAMLQALIAR